MRVRVVKFAVAALLAHVLRRGVESDEKDRTGSGFKVPWATRVAKKSSESPGPPTRGETGTARGRNGQDAEAIW